MRRQNKFSLILLLIFSQSLTAQFVKIPGTLKNIAVGKQNGQLVVYGIHPNTSIYKYSPSTTPAPWAPIQNPYRINQIDVGGDGTLMGINMAGVKNTFKYDPNNNQWLPTNLTSEQIALNSQKLIIPLAKNFVVFESNNNGMSAFPISTNKFSYIATSKKVGERLILGINRQDNKIYKHQGGKIWTLFSSTTDLKKISVGSAQNIWGINTQGNLVKWNSSTWIKQETNMQSFKDLSVNDDGIVFCVTNNGEIFANLSAPVPQQTIQNPETQTTNESIQISQTPVTNDINLKTKINEQSEEIAQLKQEQTQQKQEIEDLKQKITNIDSTIQTQQQSVIQAQQLEAQQAQQLAAQQAQQVAAQKLATQQAAKLENERRKQEEQAKLFEAQKLATQQAAKIEAEKIAQQSATKQAATQPQRTTRGVTRGTTRGTTRTTSARIPTTRTKYRR